MDEIIKLVLTRNKERKVLSKNDMKRICNIIIGLNKFDIETEFQIVNKDDSNTGGCCYNDVIIFYKEGMENILEERKADITSRFDFDGCKVDIYNFFLLSILFHEFAHARQHLIRDYGYNSPEKKIFRICYQLMDLKEFYSDNYRRFPTEVNAYNKGYIGAYDIYSHLPKEFLSDNDKNNYAMYTSDSMIDKYGVDGNKEIIVSPAEVIYKAADEFNVSKVGVDINKFKELIESKHDMTIYRKLMLGFPLSFLEFSYANMVTDVLHNGQIVDFVKKLQKKL